MSNLPSKADPFDYYLGVDLGKKQDHSVIAVIRRDVDAYRLVFLKEFRLGTEYSGVIGYIKVLASRLNSVAKICVDQTGAEYFVEDLQAVLEAERLLPREAVEGVMLSLPKKQEVLGVIKKMMEDKQLLIPYDAELIAELNVERFQLTKTGQIQFSHPAGTHDDRLFALALACYATRQETPDRSRPISISV
jgi:phage FluMu gp28-like protein